MPKPYPGSLDPLLAAVPDALVTIDERGCVVELNPAAEALFGYLRAETIGRPVSELMVAPSLRAAHEAGVERLVSGGPARLIGRLVEYRAMRSDGTEFSVELAVTRTQDAPARFTAWIRDVSGHRAVEAESARRKALLELAERLSQIGSWRWTPETGEVLWSDRLFRLFGLEPDELTPTVEYLVGRTHPEDRSRFEAAMESARAFGELPPLEIRVVGADGAVRHLRTAGALDDSAQASPRTLVGCVQDVTEHRRAESEIAAYLAVSEALTGWSSLEEGAERLLHDLVAALDFGVGVLWLPDGEALVPRAFYSTPSLAAPEFEDATFDLRNATESGIPGEAWRRRAPVDLTSLPSERHVSKRDAAGGASGIQGGLAIPAVFGEQVLAVVELCSRDKTRLTDRLTRLLTGVGYELGAFFDRRRAELVAPALTARQLEILQLAAEGLSTHEIAAKLLVARSTVKSHFERVYETLDVSNRAAAVAQAIRQGLIE